MRGKRAILNIISSLGLQVVALICGFIIPKLIITSFGSDVNGLVSSITQFLAYITLLEAGFGPVVKAALYKPLAQKDKNQIEKILKASERFFRIIALIFVVYLIVLSIVYPMIVNTQFSYIYTMSLVIIISISTLAEYYFGMTYTLYLQARQETYVTSIVQIIGYILNTITIVVLIKFHSNIHLVKLISGFIFVLRPIAQNIYVRRKYKIDLKRADKNFDLMQKWDGLAQHVASVIHANTDTVILTIFCSIKEVSVYSIYYLIVNGIRKILLACIRGVDAAFGDMIAKGEKKQLNRSFKIYELFYYTIATIIFSAALLLIIPFIKVYTMGIEDTNYIRPLFAYLLVIGEFIWIIRQPYNELIKVAGHFKQTKKGAWVEAVTNIIISLILVWKFGIVGVAIGTLVAMVIRTVELMYYTSKHILERSKWICIRRVIITVIETLIIIMLVQLLPNIEFNSYMNWVIHAMIVTIISSLVIMGINAMCCKDEVRGVINIIKNSFRKEKNK